LKSEQDNNSTLAFTLYCHDRVEGTTALHNLKTPPLILRAKINGAKMGGLARMSFACGIHECRISPVLLLLR
jgi:hypothetical protein